MRRGNVFGRVCLSICVSVCLRVCLSVCDVVIDVESSFLIRRYTLCIPRSSSYVKIIESRSRSCIGAKKSRVVCLGLKGTIVSYLV